MLLTYTLKVSVHCQGGLWQGKLELKNPKNCQLAFKEDKKKRKEKRS